MFKKLFICLLLIIIFTSCKTNNDSNNTIVITDMLGEKVEVVKNPKKVACASRTTYDLLIAFGLEEYIDGVYYSLLDNPWANVFDKNANKRYRLEYQESYETYISRGVDLVFSPEKYISDGLKEHGITAVNVSLYGKPDYSGYVYYFAQMVKQIWDSDEVTRRVDLWINKMQNTISEIQTTLDAHNITPRTVYYVRGDKNKGIEYTDTTGSFTEYAYKVLKMIPLNDRFETNRPSKEQLCLLNPDIIVIGGIYQKTLMKLLDEEPYINLNAVKNNNVYNIPIGLTMFEQVCVFSPVFFCDQANKLYPQYFSYDVNKQLQEISSEFFNINLTDVEAQNILDGLSREGELLA